MWRETAGTRRDVSFELLFVLRCTSCITKVKFSFQYINTIVNHHLQFQKILIKHKRSTLPTINGSPYPPAHSTRNLSLRICLFWALCTRRILQSVLCLASYTQHVFKVCQGYSMYSTSFLFMNEQHPLCEYIMFVHPLMDIWFTFTFWFL